MQVNSISLDDFMSELETCAISTADETGEKTKQRSRSHGESVNNLKKIGMMVFSFLLSLFPIISFALPEFTGMASRFISCQSRQKSS
jgi:hypothetical protein